MSLNRVTMAATTLLDFTLLSSAKQQIVSLLLTNRNLRDKPLQPSHYFSYKDISDKLGLKAGSIRVLVYSLIKDGWLTGTDQAKHNVDGKWVMRYKWSVTKVDDEIAEVFNVEEEKEDVQQVDFDCNPEDFFFDDTFWRKGGTLGWQRRKRYARHWSDTLTAPADVISYFDTEKLNIELP